MARAGLVKKTLFLSEDLATVLTQLVKMDNDELKALGFEPNACEASVIRRVLRKEWAQRQPDLVDDVPP